MEQKLFMTNKNNPRGTLPDAVTEDSIYLFKECNALKLTYQIELLTYYASNASKKLVIKTRKTIEIDDELKKYIDQNNKIIEIIKDLK